MADYVTRYEELRTKVRSYAPDADLELLGRAFICARDAHEGQVRKSGEPYIGHPVEVTHIVADLRLDVPALCAALMHDVIEDTDVTPDEMRGQFGAEITGLVEGLTKISKLKFRSREEAQAENIRKLIVAMSRDPRVVLIKLADRMHNIQTLQHMSESGQRRIAQETLDIYAPIANRLGIHWMKVTLEDQSLRYINPEAYYLLADRVQKTRAERQSYVRDTQSVLRDLVREHGMDAEVHGRGKHLYSIHKKMQKSQVDFEHINDLTAFRVIVGNKAECYEVLGLVHAKWRPVPGRFKDYVAIPKPNGYQSLHTTVIGPAGERIEIQIRTHEMHEIAEFGVAAHWAYKEGRASSETSSHFSWLRNLVETSEEIDDSAEYLESVKMDLFGDEVFVFTPDGDIKSLPRGATPLDFAYSVHSEVGNHCAHAKVNGRVVNLRYELQNGDRVEIITRKDQYPREEWLDIVQSSRAKAKIRQYIRAEKKDRAKEVARTMLATELKRFNLKYEKVLKTGDLQAAAELQKFQSVDQMLVAIGYGKLQAATVVERIVPPETREKKATDTGPQASMRRFGERIASMISRPRRDAIRLAGMDGEVMVTYARCCDPVPGEEIVGYVTRGRGIVVHAQNCSRLLNLEEERRVEVEWNLLAAQNAEKTKRKVSVKVVCRDEPGLLSEMSAAFTSRGVNIAQAHCRTRDDGLATNLFDVLVADHGQLTEAMKQVGRIDGVVSVERVRSTGAA